MAGRLITLAGARAGTGRRVGFGLLVLAVIGLHGGLTDEVADRAAAFGAAAQLPPRIEVVYVRELEPAAPPAIAPRPVQPPVAPTRAAAPARAASQPMRRAAEVPAEQPLQRPAESLPEARPEARPESPPVAVGELAPPEPVPPVPVEPPPVVQATPEPAASAVPAAADAAAPAFEWPGSTRLSYQLVGNWQGEVKGDAKVEWVREGNRYQVHLDVRIGAPFAPIFTRRMSSDGELSAQGLVPRRYDQDSKLIFKSRDLATLHFETDAVVLANGQRRERVAGMQDTASQFVQLAWLFTTRPELLQVGQSVELPLALPRNTYRIVYDVVAEEPVHTPFGIIPAFHLKPRRMDMKGDLRVEIWFAPMLRYLPARIRIEQDANVFIDLALSRKPELAAN